MSDLYKPDKVMKKKTAAEETTKISNAGISTKIMIDHKSQHHCEVKGICSTNVIRLAHQSWAPNKCIYWESDRVHRVGITF